MNLVGYMTCGRCPGGNIEYDPAEMFKNGAEVIHLATGFVVGYHPCPHIEFFTKFITERFGDKVVIGTHSIQQKYLNLNGNLGTWDTPTWKEIITPAISDEQTRLDYD